MTSSRTPRYRLSLLLSLLLGCASFQTINTVTRRTRHTPPALTASTSDHSDATTPSPQLPSYPTTFSAPSTRRSLLSFLVTTTTTASLLSTTPASAEEESFADLAARAAKLANQAQTIEDKNEQSQESTKNARIARDDQRTAYDFTLPVKGEDVPFGELIGQEFEKGEDGERGKGSLVKAVLIVNMKQDDPIARKNIPELISLAAKFGRNNEFRVICTPTDQGYFEPDTSELIRLKLASEYGYTLNPSAILTDKANLLGSGAHPFWRWIEGTCRTPSGLGRIQGNFEKFLVDGRTGRPLRRYPRNYQPFDIADDIDAVMKGKSLPPAGANWKEEWRQADKDAVSDQFRFQKGLNVFDQ